MTRRVVLTISKHESGSQVACSLGIEPAARGPRATRCQPAGASLPAHACDGTSPQARARHYRTSSHARIRCGRGGWLAFWAR